MNKRKTNLFILLILFSVAFSCGEEISIPKPPTYLRLDLPKHSYIKFQEQNCNYSFEIPQMYLVKDVFDMDKKKTCNKDIDFGPLNSVMFLSYINMEKPLAEYVNYSINKVDEHKIKASAIEDNSIIRSKDKVYGTFFELQGDVASPFQFYLTDSVSRFVSGVVYLNKAPKYDSLKPSLEYLKIDLKHFVETFQWK